MNYEVGKQYEMKVVDIRKDSAAHDYVNDTVKHADVPRLSKTEQVVLDAIGSHPDYSYEQLAAACGVSRPTIARTLKTLESEHQNRSEIRYE